MAIEQMQDEEATEVSVFSFRVQPRDARDLATIIELDENVDSRTEAVRAALRDYAKKLRKRAERAA
jgi:hypothetical protein